MSLGCGTVREEDYVWPIDGRNGAGHGQRVEVGCVILSYHTTPEGSWWLVEGPSAQIGQNSTLVAGQAPEGFKIGDPTHWSDDVARDQHAIINPPQDSWPDEVCVAVAVFALTRKVPGAD